MTKNLHYSTKFSDTVVFVDLQECTIIVKLSVGAHTEFMNCIDTDNRLYDIDWYIKNKLLWEFKAEIIDIHSHIGDWEQKPFLRILKRGEGVII
jgi:hypothetical protein